MARPSERSRGLAKQRAADGDALLLAAREPARAAREQGADAEQLDDAVDLGRSRRAAFLPAREPAAEEQVLAHREMGKSRPSWNT